MEIDFFEINDEIEEKDLTLNQAESVINQAIDLNPFINASENFQIIDKQSARQCLSMSLQARKMRQNLDKTRLEIIKPHFDFQKAVNKLSKSFEKKLKEIEDDLSLKLKLWIENNDEDNFMGDSIKVADGNLTKKNVWNFEIINETIVPIEFLSIDEKKVKLAISQGVRQITGVKIFEEVEINIRVKN